MFRNHDFFTPSKVTVSPCTASAQGDLRRLEVSRVLATAYLRLIRKRGPNWRGHEELDRNGRTEDSSAKSLLQLDSRPNRADRCAGNRAVTTSPERG